MPHVRDGHLEIPHHDPSRAELYTRKELVAHRVHECLQEVEAVKKRYIESQRAFFRANDEQEEIERLIMNIEEREAGVQSS